MSTLKYQSFYKRHLPHIQRPGATLFITFRLAGSIPAEVLHRLRAEAEQQEAALSCIADPKERARQAYLEQRRLFGKWDTALDTAQSGPFWLREPEVASLVAESLRYRDGHVYALDAFCIMPNHVHLVCTPCQNRMAPITPSLPSCTRSSVTRLARLICCCGVKGAFGKMKVMIMW